MDLLPRVVPADEWAVVEDGLAQRVTALNRFLDDLYVGDRAIVRDGIIPWWLLSSSDGFAREAFGVPVPLGARVLVAGSDLVRDAEGTYRVLEDNLRSPSGISYVVENRVAMTRLLPHVFANTPVRPVDHYGRSLLGALTRVAPPAAGENPTIVVLTPGVYNSAYFEHVFLAAHMGVELIEGRDLVVDDHVVYMRTTQGLQRVDVIYRRIDDSFLDPVVFRHDSTLGVPGLLAAVRAGNVTVTNAIGNGVADDKAVYPYVPEMIRFYLGEEPILPNVETYLLWDPEQRAAVLERLDQLVIKPVAEAGGYGITIGPAATDAELAACRDAILADPRGWIAQEVVSLSRHPTLVGDHLEGRHVDLRPFVVTSDTVEVIPGGLTRVAMKAGSLVVNSSQGGGSKDTWVLARTAAEVAAEEAELAEAAEGSGLSGARSDATIEAVR
nr:circularly permuted type 2 ATP-grasp protein [Rhabdothermincola salaria]